MKTCFILNTQTSGVQENTVGRLRGALNLFEDAELFAIRQKGEAEALRCSDSLAGTDFFQHRSGTSETFHEKGIDGIATRR